MAYNLRIFGYSGIIQVAQNLPKQYTADTIFLNNEPCLWSQVIAVSGAAAVSAVINLTPDPTTLVCIEVPDGQQIRYEVQPQGPTGAEARTAGNASRRASGFFNVAWGSGFTLSIIDAAGLP